MVWIGVFLLSLLIEYLSLTFFTIWFGLGAIAAYIISLLGMSFTIQLISFLIISILFLTLFRQYAIKSYKHKTNINELIGKEAIICGENANGILVKVNGIEWAAIDKGNQKSAVGECVIIRGIEGVTLLIERED